MANSITKQTIVDGDNILIVKIHIDGDGSGEETDTVLIDASSYSPAFTDCNLKILHAMLSGFTAELLWDATTNVHIVNIVDYEAHYGGEELMNRIGGLPNNAGAEKTGDILITTTGLGAADKGTIILELRKKNAG